MSDEITKLTGNTRQFAEACYDANTIDELAEAALNGADGLDMEQWGIGSGGWSIAVTAALIDLLHDAGEVGQEYEFSISPLHADNRPFTGTFQEAAETAGEEQSDVFYRGVCVWENPAV